MDSVEMNIVSWRTYMARAAGVDHSDVDELEGHLRDQIADLQVAGLDDDEAFLIAVKRLGSVDELSREFAREHSARLWRQLVVHGDEGETNAVTGREAVLLAIVAAVIVQTARVVIAWADADEAWLVRNASWLVVPLLAAWFVRRRQLRARALVPSLVASAVAAIVLNVYPYSANSSTELLAAAHLPIALWFVVAFPFANGTLRSFERRMDFVRFTGEWCIYYVLIALGGGVLTGLSGAILEPVGVDRQSLASWVLPAGAAGAVIVAAWLVEAKQHVVENMAPVLTMVFTPLFALMLTTAAVLYAVHGFGEPFDRELLGIFDALLVVVLGLVVYSTSAREPTRAPGWDDRIQLVAVVASLTLDAMVLASMVARISDLGLTPNRIAALGLNVILLADLAGSTWLSIRFLTRRDTFHRLERWHVAYLPALAVWAAIVAVALPLVFGFE
jgi:hypothetical protein